MAMSIIDNYSLEKPYPNFERDMFQTIEEMKNFSSKKLPTLFIATCVETGKVYLYNKNNEADPVLGKWREFTGGGSSEPSSLPVDCFAVLNIEGTTLSDYSNGDYLFDCTTQKVYLVTITTAEEVDNYSTTDVTNKVVVDQVAISNELYNTLDNSIQMLPISWLVD